jgi:hypothetical protein
VGLWNEPLTSEPSTFTVIGLLAKRAVVSMHTGVCGEGAFAGASEPACYNQDARDDNL